jgi:acetoin:2,6-dichlorophenolindophenol oxidoreductase subunit alpha
VVEKQQLRDFYRDMVRIMVWENTLLRMVDEGRVAALFHPCRGQEAVSVGAVAAMGKDDYMMYAHRGCGYQIARGMTMTAIFGDFFGNMAGPTTGIGAGIVHLADPSLGIMGQSGTIGGCFPIAAGLAFAAKYRKSGQVCLCFFGDATSNRGTFHESLNAAAAWKLPVVWLLENNLYGVSTRIEAMTGNPHLVDRAISYGIPGISVDGFDPEAVYEVTKEAIERARAGEGPTLIEAHHYRFKGHGYGDFQGYRTKEEVQEWMKKDPIPRLAKRLLEDGIATQAELDEIHTAAQKEVNDAVDEAWAAPFPPNERIYEGLWAKGTE